MSEFNCPHDEQAKKKKTQSRDITNQQNKKQLKTLIAASLTDWTSESATFTSSDEANESIVSVSPSEISNATRGDR